MDRQSSPLVAASSSSASALRPPALARQRSRSRSRDIVSPPASPRPAALATIAVAASTSPRTPRGSSSRRLLGSPLSRARKSASTSASSYEESSAAGERAALLRARARSARAANDSMVYLDGPNVYGCASCRTHLTSHDDIISKSFHGRRGRAYLFERCVNVSVGPPEDRLLITGMHSVCDIRCRRCDIVVGWTYRRAYEPSQKYKEGKFIVEKINLHMEESPGGCYDVDVPAGERGDRWRKRSISWGSASEGGRSGGGFPHSPGSRRSERSRAGSEDVTVYEYRPDGGDVAGRLGVSPYQRTQSLGSGIGTGGRALPPGPPNL
mmetsp:Transcript_19106/g.55537  ORF Transcript_19106/g.55537 Transcript_19106/m.55537 type:complete len:324 (-) Transcript_19106:319-1290(-)